MARRLISLVAAQGVGQGLPALGEGGRVEDDQAESVALGQPPQEVETFSPKRTACRQPLCCVDRSAQPALPDRSMPRQPWRLRPLR